ncbi:kinetochore Sim4 complex subunit FTA2-domain-containing protein [Aspergillus pseudonomiae]|nr:kinetochore Sim4 complex subunit FTA2-domain-containing protein [Aspergillus pseudonomiae]
MEEVQQDHQYHLFLRLFIKPKLKRFVGYKDAITNPVFVDKGEQGFVFRFKHNERDLCLKLFYDYEDPRPYHEKTIALISPIGLESRAFARLCDLHGKWPLGSALREASGRVRNNWRWHKVRWGIVKDFIADEPPSCQDERFRLIISNFSVPKRGQILPRDVKKENYRGELIVDLGSTVTFPFYRYFARQTDLDKFFEALDQFGLPAWDR